MTNKIALSIEAKHMQSWAIRKLNEEYEYTPRAFWQKVKIKLKKKTFELVGDLKNTTISVKLEEYVCTDGVQNIHVVFEQEKTKVPSKKWKEETGKYIEELQKVLLEKHDTLSYVCD